MSIPTFNIHGCGDSIKRRRLCKILGRGNVGVCFLQETKVQKMKEVLVNSMWGSEDCE